MRGVVVLMLASCGRLGFDSAPPPTDDAGPILRCANAVRVPKLSGDVTGDGIDDLIVASIATMPSDHFKIYAGGMAGGLPEHATINPGGALVPHSHPLRVFDWTRDGKPDLILGTDGPLKVLAGPIAAGSHTLAEGLSLGFSVDRDLPSRMLFADVTGDGKDDLVVGAYSDAGGTLDWDGIVSVYSDWSTLAGTVTALREWRGPTDSRFGGALNERALDVNGDGALDLVIGAANRGDVDQGSGYLITGPIGANTNLGQPVVDGTTDYQYTWYDLAVLDVDCDGKLDLVTGTPGDDPTRKGLVEVRHGPLASQRRQMISGEPNMTLGSRFAVADLDGDGADDLLIGGGGTDQNSTSVIRGYLSGIPLAEGPAFELVVDDLMSSFADDDIVVGDFNGDGRDDFAVAESDNTGGRGRVFVFSGRTPRTGRLDAFANATAVLTEVTPLGFGVRLAARPP